MVADRVQGAARATNDCGLVLFEDWAASGAGIRSDRIPGEIRADAFFRHYITAAIPWQILELV